MAPVRHPRSQPRLIRRRRGARDRRCADPTPGRDRPCARGPAFRTLRGLRASPLFRWARAPLPLPRMRRPGPPTLVPSLRAAPFLHWARAQALLVHAAHLHRGRWLRGGRPRPATFLVGAAFGLAQNGFSSPGRGSGLPCVQSRTADPRPPTLPLRGGGLLACAAPWSRQRIPRLPTGDARADVFDSKELTNFMFSIRRSSQTLCFRFEGARKLSASSAMPARDTRAPRNRRSAGSRTRAERLQYSPLSLWRLPGSHGAEVR